MNADPAQAWIDVAEEDFSIATGLSRRRKHRVPAGVCYHCQQCAEKYLKAILVRNGTAQPRTHDLNHLLDMCAAIEPSLELLRADAGALNPLSTRFRYPGLTAAESDAESAMASIRSVRRTARSLLGI